MVLGDLKLKLFVLSQEISIFRDIKRGRARRDDQRTVQDVIAAELLRFVNYRSINVN